MAGPHVVVMNSGGLRSLVATALVLREREDIRVSLLHIVDGRENAATRHDHVRRQAEHFELARLGEIHLPHLYGPAPGMDQTGGEARLVAPQMLLAAMDYARCHQAERIIWPHAVNADDSQIASTTERTQLVEHLADIDGATVPQLQAPLLEMTDQQVIELGVQLDVPWAFAWSCQRSANLICRSCLACRRRQTAFAAAGQTDPSQSPVPSHAGR